MTTESTDSELRKTGISIIGDMPWGTHFCHFYETKQDLLDTLIPYFKAGLENKEFCLWVVSQPLTVEEARHAMGQAVPDLDQHLAERSLEIHTHNEWYLHAGQFDPQRVIRRWHERMNEALARGYAGMRASANTAWIKKEHWRDFREYEKEVDALITAQRMIILCTYPLTTSPGDQVFDVARIHQVAVARRHGSWEMFETPELKQAKAEITRLNDELEQQVEERTRELATTNEALKRQVIERKEAERQSRVLIDAIPHQIWSGPPDGTLDYCNERWRSYVGLDLEGLRGEGWQAMLHPDDRERVLKAWHESVVNGTPYEQEERHRAADGTYRWFLSRGVPLRDAEGRIVRWYGTNTDIEDRKQAEEELKKEKEILARIFDNIPVMIGFVGADGGVKLVNPEWERTIGWTLKELQEQNVDIFAEAYPDLSYRREVLDFVAASTGEWVDLKIKVRDGRVIDAACAVVHLSDGTKVAIAQNITERKQAEEKLKATSEQLRALSARLQSVREEEATRISREIHDDLGQKLTALKMDLVWSRRKLAALPESPEASPVLDRIAAMTTLVDELVASVQEIATDLRPALLDELGLGAALQFEADRFQERTGIECEVRWPESEIALPANVTTALFRIFQECLTNVVRHAQAIKVEVEMKVESRSIFLSVHDNGRGVPPAAISNTSSLGLLGMKERASLLGGEVLIESHGDGTTVSARIPLPETMAAAAPVV
jgi:PAS domain S-box-containing protein